MRDAPGRSSTAIRVAGVTVLLLVLSGCADAPQDSLQPAGEWARKIDNLWQASFFIAVVIFVLVQGLLLFALVRFRSRPGNEAPRQVHGSTPLEIGWTILPALILAALAVPTVATIFDLDRTPEDALDVEVIGHQWWWEFHYPDYGIRTANEMHVPAGRDINVMLDSYDVIHSFWVPQLAGKVDAIPGRDNRFTLAADGPGVFLGQCAEFCGLSHANMRVRVIAHEPGDFETWVEEQQRTAVKPEEGLALDGHDLFVTAGCIACHNVTGHEAGEGGRVGPDLTHLQSRSTFAGAIFDLTSENLARWLADPPGMKPMQPEETSPRGEPIGMPNLGLTPDEIEALVAYLETLE